MIRISSFHELRRAEISPELKKFLTEKFVNIIAEYGMSDMNEVFSVMILSEDEVHYIADKYLEFSEMMYFDNMKYIHTVWAASDGYSEDIYIPYSTENEEAIARRCL